MQREDPGAPKEGAKRIWWAIAVGTTIQTVALVSLIAGALISASGETEPAGPAFALGFVLVPVVCALVAFISGHERAPLATLKGMGVWVVVGLPLSLVNPVIGLSTGFAASGAFTLKSLAVRSGKRRAFAVLGLAFYLALLLVVLPQAALFAGAVTPLLAVRAADYISERAESVAET